MDVHHPEIYHLDLTPKGRDEEVCPSRWRVRYHDAYGEGGVMP
jgi:predicted dithiol-disulfide oxidoreductase (DUF899 family)